MAQKSVSAKDRREDYALRYVPESFRLWHWSSIFSVFIGVSTAMFFLAWGGQLTLEYGTWPTIWGMVFGVVLIGSVGFFFSWVGSRTGLDSDLITRGSGYGFMGSAIASLVYSFNYLMFFAFEGSILVAALQASAPHVPVIIWELLIGVTFLVLAIWGMSFLSWLMWITLPIYIVAVSLVFYHAAHVSHPIAWLSYKPAKAPSTVAGPVFLQLGATVFALISMATQGADLGRFVRKKDQLVGSIFNGYVVMIVTFLGVVLLGSYFGLEFHQTNPGTYFSSVLGIGGMLTVIITQLRINTINVYSGSLAYSNFFSRVFHFTPGRQWWGILTAVLGTLLMMGNIFAHMLQVLTFEGVFIIAWAMSVVSDTLFNKWLLKINTRPYEYKRAFLPHFNPVGVGTLILALVIAAPLAFGVAGPLGENLAPFVSAALGLIFPPVIALALKGRPYRISSTAQVPVTSQPTLECILCHEEFETVDMVICPFHEGALCSVCCGSNAQCHDVCKTEGVMVQTLTVEQPSS
ncbi:Purine-cytosine permease [Sulfobacillus thermosulfidooxidans DSM 9293]|uniref:Purine-cytosine permease n=1 Tax=Sulfobacillus thermosulfidooxidans (strain DSM 9293 / VKM B-1269 / AT-1) TaxID=929705 RepID=A0A1W1WG14_SULTA|nr:hypothetical protein [Sulfobacillus thermosulfidooxidans]SMC04653.1 Purine-cytosine permease [Sulfobacillus thermosulfidooxidans DSM 9293]